MAWFGFHPSVSAPVLETERLRLQLPDYRDYAQWARLRESSRAFLMPWEPLWPKDDLTLNAFRRRVRRYGMEYDRLEAVTFFLFRKSDDTLLGGLTLGNIRMGIAETATLGYWMGAPFAGHGFMSEAVRRVASFSFEELKLHRLEAACVPHNGPSKNVLQSVGFQREGMARCYLKIAGQWQDHLLYALLSSDLIWQKPVADASALPSE